MTIYPVILSGGAGSRLWPLSRTNYPKQFLPILGDDTLLQATAERFSGWSEAGDPIVVCNESHRFVAAEQLKQIDMPAKSILLEPVGRNTAPAAITAALEAISIDEEAVLVFLPSDHVIKGDNESFRSATMKAVKAAQEGYLVCYGVAPTSPETGFGYIKASTKETPIEGVSSVENFTEKPDKQTALQFINSGDYFWNSGMFVFKASVLLEELGRLAPEMVADVKKAYETAVRDFDFVRLDKKAFTSVNGESLDYALMEKTDRAAVVKFSGSWSDVGSFPALADAYEKCENGNVFLGDVLAIDSKNSFVRAEHGLVAALGVEDLIIVSTDDAILVASSDRAQDIKLVVDQLKVEEREEADHHSQVHRPWGSYRSLAKGPNFQVKELIVKPGKRLSVQFHHHRAEHWVVVEGTARVTNGDEEFLMEVNQSTYIPVGVVHRLENQGKIPVRIIEVQSGTYLGEDDIVRLEDDFARTSSD